MVVGVGIREAIFGYCIITIDKCYIKNAASLIIKLGLCATVSSDGRFCIGIKDSRIFLNTAPKEWIIHVSEPCGLYGAIISYRRCVGAVVGCIFALIIYLFLSMLVWDVRIEGNKELSDSQIISALEDVGVGVGSVFAHIDIGKAETDLLSLVDELSWVSINRKGTVAYVVVKERERADSPQEGQSSMYCDIVAKSDGVIYSMTVKSGTPLVKVGDTVKAGQTLIAGYIEMDGRITPTRAEGEILAERYGEISVFVEGKEERKTEFVGEYMGLKIKIFNFYLNILKNSGKIENKCDIIEDEEVCMLFGRFRLPITITRIHSLVRMTSIVEYSKTEMTEIAGDRIKSLMPSYLASGEIVKLRSQGEFCDGGYRLTNYLVFLEQIGAEKSITQNIEERQSD